MTDLHNKETAVEFYDIRYEAGYMEEWDDLKKSKVREVLSQLDLPLQGKVLDFGCGNGVFTKIIKDVLPAWDVYGVEISKIAIQNASKKFQDCLFFNAEDSYKYLNQFDFLFSHHVIEHVPDLNETFAIINSYLKNTSSQLHILPCGNVGSFEYEICKLKKNGIEINKENRFFFEEPGHLRRLNTSEFENYESHFGFRLQKEFYSNQYHGAINWITKSSPRFVKRLTDPTEAISKDASKKLRSLRKQLLPLTYLQFPYFKYWEIKSKWRKKVSDYIKMAIFFFPALFSKPIYKAFQKKAMNEWINHKAERNGSEMFLFFVR